MRSVRLTAGKYGPRSGAYTVAVNPAPRLQRLVWLVLADVVRGRTTATIAVVRQTAFRTTRQVSPRKKGGQGLRSSEPRPSGDIPERGPAHGAVAAWLSSGHGGSQSGSGWLDRSRASRRVRHVPARDPAHLRRRRDRAGALACRSLVFPRGRRSEELSARTPPRTDAERAKKVPRADNKSRSGGPTTPPSCPRSRLSGRKGDQQAVHPPPGASKTQLPRSQRAHGRCRLEPRS